MKCRRTHITTEVEVDIDIDTIIDSLDDDTIAEIARENGYLIAGEGDAARQETLVERAYLAARRMGDIPRELADLFWHVHGRAI